MRLFADLRPFGTYRRASTGGRPGRTRKRSRFLAGVAEAMVDQWGDHGAQRVYREPA
jgi:hypothetical protein